jgi:hypothetical protein
VAVKGQPDIALERVDTVFERTLVRGAGVLRHFLGSTAMRDDLRPTRSGGRSI